MTTPNPSEQAPPQTALVTGSTGFIGGHLVRHLSRLGWKVHALARQVSTDPDIALAATWHSYNGDYESVSRAVASSEPNVVFHLASLFLSEHKPEQIDALVNANLRFGMHLLEAMHQHNVRRLINTGTSWQHYNNADYDPVNLYAATKQAFEAIIDYYCNAHQFSAITLKLFDTYGPGDRRGKIVEKILTHLKANRHLDLSPGYQQLNLTHVLDTVETLSKLAAKVCTNTQTKHKRFFLKSVDQYSIREIVGITESVTRATLKCRWGALPPNKRQFDANTHAHANKDSIITKKRNFRDFLGSNSND
jgi:nucleoside-diphosphate-sugar epimerase